MEISGLLRIHVIRGINLVVRDTRGSSDPYAVVRSGLQKVKTDVRRGTLNPEWDEELTIHVKDLNPPTLTVYDKDTFTDDDDMGHANIAIKPLLECSQMDVDDLPDGTTLERVQPDDQNCLSEERCIMWTNGKIVQDMKLNLQNVESGEVEIQVEWLDLPGDIGIRI